MLIQDKKIAIVGGGPGGLTLARLLQIAGANVKVFERDVHKNVRVQGATLDLHKESGLKALQKANLMDAFKANYRAGAEKLRIVDSQGKIHFDDHQEKKMEEFRPEIDRGPLRKMLLASLNDETVIWNSKFQTMEKYKNGWKIFFENGNSTYADIVIGADGAKSKIRPFLTPIKPIYSGVTMIDATIHNAEIESPTIYKLLKGGKIFAFGNEKTLIVSSKEKGEMSFYTGCKTDENWFINSGINFKDKDQILEWFKVEYAQWNNIWQELFESKKTIFIPRPQYYLPIDQTWETQENLTIIGDAAHVMPPFAGEGVNMAMLDALTLSQNLTNSNFENIKLAMQDYEIKMRSKASEITQLTLQQTKSLHSKNALQNMLEMFNNFEQ
ncbi:2-polyprenyl-6-methoxyphenol hydroxylase-like oxidoreductase [Bernardetia litoralis DSM 6794]|uniref:Flavin-dependent monooxygenase n=1 Tax=Bernardetia litoralis (strain ATCC 23117 / DSM 6794 / NBRC 15988 / NCIMB 1366 / Fx l1 / Sio-4) TaxID=880071 RepID=I4ALF6_BERLS|nr:NAD(P)/FAD-dependent oxidoreductase [Bernardetia litoralis]AFM04791.1 2-polyprenyl-6-methoxyphenol hydroxylase-like oxidoreductase [Bernardetia litoralis DSM 6794]